MNLDSIAVYVHSPFCPTKCGYCDFNSYAMDGEIVERTARAMIREILQSPTRGIPAKTVFFGGGTPTFFPSSTLAEILEAVREVHPIRPGTEVTSEANPGTVDADKFEHMRQAGFNRVSLGAQSFQDDELVRLGRVHRSGEIERAVHLARQAGFDNINLDLMFALPDQASAAWRSNLQRAIDLNPEHLSLYCLTIEPNTAFHQLVGRGQLTLPDEDRQVEMYETACQMATDAGFLQYEISNFSKPGYECQHNLCYWRAESYAGYGPGAVGFTEGVRYTNLKHPRGYCEAVEAGLNVAYERESIDETTHRTEQIMLGIRLNSGLDTQGLKVDDRSVRILIDRKWIEKVHPERISLTPSGRHFCTEVALELIG